MITPLSNITRLAREEFHNPQYIGLVRSLFGENQLEERLRYCQWLYAQNPEVKGTDPLPIYIYRVGGRPVGQLGIIRVALTSEEITLRAGWMVDFFILPEYQRQGFGARLIAAAQEDLDLIMTFGQTESSRNLFLKHDFVEHPQAVSYKLFLRPTTSALKLLLIRVGLRHWLSHSRNSTVGSRWKGQIVRVEELEHFRQIELKLYRWREVAKHVQVVSRTENYLDWRYRYHPFLKYRIWQIGIPGTEASAIFIFRVKESGGWKRGLMVDLMVTRGAAEWGLDSILMAAMQQLRHEGVEIFETITTDNASLCALPNRIYSKREHSHYFLYKKGHNNRNDTGTLEDNWSLFSGDCDLDAIGWLS